MIDSIPSPCFVLEKEKLIRNLEILQNYKQEADVQILAALKAFAMWEEFPLIAKYLDGAAASSLNEVKLIHGHMNCLAHTYAPAYSETDFDEISALSSHITFNSINQFEHFRLRLSKDKHYALRINPAIRLSNTEMYDPCAKGSRLGMQASQLPAVLPEEITGFHVHVLCENGADELELLLEKLHQEFSAHLSQINWLNLGGGHLITDKKYDQHKAAGLLRAFKKEYDVNIILEPGSAIAWQSGFLKSTILDIVESDHIKTAILDVSFTAHMPDCLEMPYKPVVLGETLSDKGLPYRLGGSSCLAGDYIGNFMFDKELTVGDTVIFQDMMHYTMVKTTMFNGVRHPSIGELNHKDGFKLLRIFTYADFENRLG